MSDRVKIFWLEPTDRQRCWLRRFTSISKHKCGSSSSYCNAMVAFGERDILYQDGLIGEQKGPKHSDPRWPLKCDACGSLFDPVEDAFQVFTLQIYVRPDTGQLYVLREAPPGACWNAWWVSDRRQPDGPTGCGYMLGDDHRSLVVKCPDGHEWMVDSRASNCTMPEENTHHCWVRHGNPEDGTLHVDKDGHTCAAGAGSIQTANWHGFLHSGELHT